MAEFCFAVLVVGLIVSVGLLIFAAFGPLVLVLRQFRARESVVIAAIALLVVGIFAIELAWGLPS